MNNRVLLKNDFEISMHSVESVKSSTFKNELAALFPDVNVKSKEFIIIPTAQKSNIDLVQIGSAIEEEKDRLLNEFAKFSLSINEKCKAKNIWFDYVDPSSGYPMIHCTSTKVYDEVDSIQKLLKFRIISAGCCRVLVHPEWGTKFYPATMFMCIPATDVPSVESILADVFEEWWPVERGM